MLYFATTVLSLRSRRTATTEADGLTLDTSVPEERQVCKEIDFF